MTKEKNNPKRMFLVDGTALAYRSFFAFIRNPLINSKGINTSGPFGFTGALLKLLREEKPEYIACVFDTSGPTFRHRAFPQYKATREKMPEELAAQLPVIRQIVESFRIPVLEKAGFEADDVMGTIARKAEAAGFEVMLVTGDKDLMQLVSDRISMYVMGKSGSGGEPVVLNEAGVADKMGVPPSRVIEFLGLTGDSSDNVPGVRGIGPKTALSLLAAHQSIPDLYAHLDQVRSEKIREKLEACRDEAMLSRKLVTIDTAVDLDVSLEDLRKEEPDREKIANLFRELEFTRFLEEMDFGVAAESVPDRSYVTIQSEDALNRFLNEVGKKSMFALDLETTSLDPLSADIVGLSFSWEACKAYYIPVRFPDENRTGDLFNDQAEKRQDEIITLLKPVLENPGIRKCGQNIKYDWRVLKHHGVDLQGVDFDTMVAAYLVNPTSRQFNMDALSLEYLRLKKIPTTDLIGTGKTQISMADVPLDRISEYACEDADAAFQLRSVLEPRLKNTDLDKLFADVEMPLIRVLVEMESTGVALDTDLMKQMSRDMDRQLDSLKEEIYGLAGETFNMNSTQQLGHILFEKLKVHELIGGRKPRRTKTGFSTDVRVLESLSAHPLPGKMLDYRQLTKLKSTYVDALPRLIHPKTGRVHASFNQTVTATGRLSTSDPNLQNIPIRTDLGREIRKAFVAGKPGWKILSADYSQIELRLMAHLSGDKTLIESFRKGEDVHTRTASEIFGVPQAEVSGDLRRRAKTINFGIMYGMGAYGLASRLSIPQEEAQNFITAYFARYPQVNDFIADTIARAYKEGYVTTLLNRRRYLPELGSDNRNVREFGERTAVNTPIQGTAADLIKVAMIRIAGRLRGESWASRMILQIHDELLFEVPEKEVKRLSKMVTQEMEGAIQLHVPIRVDVGVGENWYDAH